MPTAGKEEDMASQIAITCCCCTKQVLLGENPLEILPELAGWISVDRKPFCGDCLALFTDHLLLVLCFVLPDTIRFSPCKPTGFSPQWNVTILGDRSRRVPHWYETPAESARFCSYPTVHCCFAGAL